VRDLLNAVGTAPVRRAIDLGCGPGNSTEVLAQRFPRAAITGLDSSPEMIEAARRRLPQIRFEVADLTQWAPAGKQGVILANAVLQWVPDHAALLPRLASWLDEGGSLAVQMPDNLEEPAYALMREVAGAGTWADKLASAAGMRSEMGGPEWYYRVLRPHCRRVDVWRTTYCHVLAGGADAIVEWFKGSGLRPYLVPLDAAEREAFLGRYRDGIAKAYTVLPDGSALLPFPRLFLVGTR
jgi:trans-aconitate 2-methyltransferase